LSLNARETVDFATLASRAISSIEVRVLRFAGIALITRLVRADTRCSDAYHSRCRAIRCADRVTPARRPWKHVSAHRFLQSSRQLRDAARRRVRPTAEAKLGFGRRAELSPGSRDKSFSLTGSLRIKPRIEHGEMCFEVIASVARNDREAMMPAGRRDN